MGDILNLSGNHVLVYVCEESHTHGGEMNEYKVMRTHD